MNIILAILQSRYYLFNLFFSFLLFYFLQLARIETSYFCECGLSAVSQEEFLQIIHHMCTGVIKKLSKRILISILLDYIVLNIFFLIIYSNTGLLHLCLLCWHSYSIFHSKANNQDEKQQVFRYSCQACLDGEICCCSNGQDCCNYILISFISQVVFLGALYL